jgi:putative ABC transport system permease protein
MQFLVLIFKNILRRKARSIFTVLGISIGIATIVALGALMNGMTASMEGVLKSGEADFFIAQSGISDLSFSRIDENRTGEIMAMNGVQRVAGALIGIYPVGSNPYVMVWGVNTEDLQMLGVSMLNGSVFSNQNELIMGETISRDLEKKVGDNLTLRQEEFTITGIYQTGAIYQDRSLAMPLDKLQELDRKEGCVTAILVELDEGANLDAVCSQVEERFPDLATIKSASELGKVDQGLEIMDAATLAVSVLAITVGGIGVTNTMMMSFFERTKEIGVLRAIGWRRRRVLTMILGESVLLCIFSVLVGSLLGVVGVRLLMLEPIIRSMLEPIFTLETFVRAIIVAFAVGLLGGSYPAYRASKLSPSEALRYE